MTNGFLSAENYVDPTPRPVPLWGHRANRALYECRRDVRAVRGAGDPIQLAGKNDSMTAFWAMSYFWLRAAHAVVFFAVPFIRTMIFVLGFVCIVGLFIELMK